MTDAQGATRLLLLVRDRARLAGLRVFNMSIYIDSESEAPVSVRVDFRRHAGGVMRFVDFAVEALDERDQSAVEAMIDREIERVM